MRRSVGLAAVVALSITAELRAQEYQVDLDEPRLVEFVSEARIESFKGVTDRIDGYVALACPHLSAGSDCSGSEFYFEVDLNSIDTGNGLRNHHMRRNYLETEEFPYASLEGSIHRITDIGDGQFSIGASARLTVHGVERDVGLSCPVEEHRAGYAIRCALQASLPDHDIKIPSIMIAKLAETVDLRVSFVVTPIDADNQD